MDTAQNGSTFVYLNGGQFELDADLRDPNDRFHLLAESIWSFGSRKRLHLLATACFLVIR